MAHLITLIAFLLGFPFLIMWSEKRARVVRWISPIVICYLAGILIGNIPGLDLNREVQETASMFSVVLAIPLLLFSANLPVLLKQVRPALFSFFLGIFGVLLVASLAFLLFKDRIAEAHAASGMMVGCYTGGTQNMTAIGLGLGVEEEVFVLLNSADIVFSGIYLLFLLTAAHRILSSVLPSFRQKLKVEEIPAEDQPEKVQPGKVVHVLAGLALALVVVGISAGSSLLVFGKLSEPVVILLITTLGIGSSFFRKVRALPSTFSTANYMLLVFAVAVGSMANFRELLEASSALFWFVGFVVFGSILVHYLLAILFRVDRDTLIITSTAAIFGPAFIGPVATAIGNKDIITIGIALGLIGYALGNYLGLGLAYILNLAL